MLYLVFFLLHFFMEHSLTVKSPAFENNGFIPARYTCSGQNINPEINITGIPEKAKTLALIMDDPDAPGTFDHWVMWNMSVKGAIKENSAPGREGLNGKKENKYTGPCPPSGVHHYHFKAYALDIRLELKDNTDKSGLERAMQGHILATGELIGLYKK
jgi:Raf kinase inhibitor-like YbhB/YbcL family protein